MDQVFLAPVEGLDDTIHKKYPLEPTSKLKLLIGACLILITMSIIIVIVSYSRYGRVHPSMLLALFSILLVIASQYNQSNKVDLDKQDLFAIGHLFLLVIIVLNQFSFMLDRYLETVGHLLIILTVFVLLYHPNIWLVILLTSQIVYVFSVI